MGQQIINDLETYGTIRGKINANFTELYSVVNQQSIIQVLYNTTDIVKSWFDGVTEFFEIDFTNWEGVPVGTVNSWFTKYPTSAISNDINALVDGDNNVLLYNERKFQTHTFRFVFDFFNKETNKEYNLVFKVEYPDGSFAIQESENLVKKDASGIDKSVEFFTGTTDSNNWPTTPKEQGRNLKVFWGLKKHNEDAGAPSNLVVRMKSLTRFTGIAI